MYKPNLANVIEHVTNIVVPIIKKPPSLICLKDLSDEIRSEISGNVTHRQIKLISYCISEVKKLAKVDRYNYAEIRANLRLYT